MLKSPAMARRPERDTEDVLTSAELKELRENLSRLSPQHVQEFYQRAYEDCRMIISCQDDPDNRPTTRPESLGEL
jgi:hypothetical protein